MANSSVSEKTVEHCPVLIVGSSMVGMTLSALLTKHGVTGCITVEKHSSTAIRPRAALFHPRTMQIYRELGLYDAMSAESAKHYDEHAGIVDVESLAGRYIQSYMKDMNEGIENISPTNRIFLTQQMFEPILREKALKDGASLQFSTEMVDFQQDADGVTATVRSMETGETRAIRARYMVACDGNRSAVREKLGIKNQGHGLLSRSVTIYFNADVEKHVKGKYNGVIYINNETVRGFFRLDKTGKEGFLVVNTAGERGAEESRYPADNLTDERAAELLRAAIGDDTPFEITFISKWLAVCDVAEHFGTGKVLLAGDAAHTVTPQGGFGGNTGIHDAHNLAWKLALVLGGKAHPSLVEQTYHDERFPVGRLTVNQVFERYVHRTAPELRTPDLEIEEELPEPHIELGYRYHSKALMTKELGELVENPATATARPGSLAHHVVVSTTDRTDFPIADLLGQDYVLVAGPDGAEWEAAGKELKSDQALPKILTHRIKGSSKFCEKYGIQSDGAVLIRPDSVVAWSDASVPIEGTAVEVLRQVMGQILCFDGSQT